MLKAPCKNDAGFTGSPVACSGLASEAENAFIGVCLIGGHECSTVLEMFGLLGRQFASVCQKGRFFSFFVGQRRRPEETFIYSDFGTSFEKDEAPSLSRWTGRQAHCTRNTAVVVKVILRRQEKYQALSRYS